MPLPGEGKARSLSWVLLEEEPADEGKEDFATFPREALRGVMGTGGDAMMGAALPLPLRRWLAAVGVGGGEDEGLEALVGPNGIGSPGFGASSLSLAFPSPMSSSAE